MKTCNDAPVGYTNHPPVGEWQGWNGGVCPVHPLAMVEYMMESGNRFRDNADQLAWEKNGDDWDIIAYRIVEEYKAPEPGRGAEFYATLDSHGYWVHCPSYAPNATLFREVLE